MYRILRNSAFELVIVEECPVNGSEKNYFRYTTFDIKNSPKGELVKITQEEAFRYLVGVGRSVMNSSLVEFSDLNELMIYIQFQGERQIA